jgi:hypothetical protein
VGSEIVGSPALQQCGSGRTELVEKITQLKALLRVERKIGHAAGVYGGHRRDYGALHSVADCGVMTTYAGCDWV